MGLFNWIKKEDVFHDGRAVVVSSMPTLPEYNTKLVSKVEPPKKWMDLADLNMNFLIANMGRIDKQFSDLLIKK